MVIVVTVYTAGTFAIVEGAAEAAAAGDAAVGASAYTAGETLAIGGQALSGAGTISFGGAALAGAAGNIAGQITGNALGTQDGFSWKSVALAAISQGVSTGLGLRPGQP